MTCRTCQTDMLRCTEVTERVIIMGAVTACKGYKPYIRTITIGLWHSVTIGLLVLVYAFIIGIFIGHEMTWKVAETQQIRDRETMLRDGIKGRPFSLPKSAFKLYPRGDKQYNVKKEIEGK